MAVSKTSLEDWCSRRVRRPKTLTNLSSWGRIFKDHKTSFLDVLKPKLDALFETVIYCLQHVFITVLKTSLEDWPSRRVWRLKNVNRPVVLKTYFQTPQDQFSKRVEAQTWHPFQNWYTSRSQQYHSWILETSVYRLNTVCNTSTYTSWRGAVVYLWMVQRQSPIIAMAMRQ